MPVSASPLTSASPSFHLSARALTLRPVAARVVSYGRSNKMAQRATLYVLRVARGGREWFVARRFSEFRALYARLRVSLATPHATPSGSCGPRMCAQCRELARRFSALAFPSRFPVRSALASAREKIESARMQQLDAFVQMLLETTQGLLANQDDDDDAFDSNDEDDDGTREDRCDALRLVREFLLVHDHLDDETKPKTDATPESPNQQKPRLLSSGSLGSMTTTFRVQELDVMYRPTSPPAAWICVGDSTPSVKATSPNVLDDHELDELFLADYASPAEDAVIHRQLEGDVELGGAAVHALRRAESLRMSRRL